MTVIEGHRMTVIEGPKTTVLGAQPHKMIGRKSPFCLFSSYGTPIIQRLMSNSCNKIEGSPKCYFCIKWTLLNKDNCDLPGK